MPTANLVIEDEPAISDSLVYVLRREGFMVNAVDTLAAGRLAFVAPLPARIVFDVNLPDGNGFDFCRERRRLRRFRCSSSPPVRARLVGCGS